jgi:hypothetical protein
MVKFPKGVMVGYFPGLGEPDFFRFRLLPGGATAAASFCKVYRSNRMCRRQNHRRTPKSKILSLHRAMPNGLKMK